MPRKKKITEVVVETVETVPAPAPEPVEVATESEAKKAFRASMESYKAKSPIKYAQKEAALLKKLNSL